MKKILVLGGTGAMGVPLVNELSMDKNNLVYVTSRSSKTGNENVKFLCGNAKEDEFLESLLNQEYDAIIDFLVYSTKEFEDRVEKILDHTKQYFFFSSARCYADSQTPITENSSRLIDVCKDIEYLKTDEYGLAKGKEENILKGSRRNNWTIIRPYITYNDYRIQLGVFEKENWLRRALCGKTIVFPKDIADRRTSLTYGPDVARNVVKLIGNEKAYGEAFHITTSESHKWSEILYFYCDILEKKTGKRPKVIYVNDSQGLQNVWNPWQIRYDRLYDRVFDNSKIEDAIGDVSYRPTFEGLEECLCRFLDNPMWQLRIKWKYEAWCDSVANEFTSIKEINGNGGKYEYIKWRVIFGIKRMLHRI